MYDVAVIGAGIVGTSIARELSRYRLNILLLEKEKDVANGTTKANSAIVHAGYDPETGSLKARFNVEGNQQYEALCKELEVPFKRTGSLVVAYSDEERDTLNILYQRGVKNKVPEMKILDADTLQKWEPHISPRAVAALHAPTTGIVGPWELAIALAENAVENGVELLRECGVTDIQKSPSGEYSLTTTRGIWKARSVVNAAGLYADSIHEMVAEKSFTITPSRGEYMLFDKKAGNYVEQVIFQCPTESGKNVVVLPTVHGNLLVGPTHHSLMDKEARETTEEGLEELRERTRDRFVDLPWNQVITSFSGLRAKSEETDFIIGESPQAKGFFNAAAIDSPGLTAAPAIGKHMAALVIGFLENEHKLEGVQKKEDFRPERSAIRSFAERRPEEQRELISSNPAFGRVICRCETITEGEILEAIHRPAGAVTMDGVKRRTRAGGGRCQGGFCGPRVLEIIARELNIPPTSVLKDGRSSWILSGQTKSAEGDKG